MSTCLMGIALIVVVKDGRREPMGRTDFLGLDGFTETTIPMLKDLELECVDENAKWHARILALDAL